MECSEFEYLILKGGQKARFEQRSAENAFFEVEEGPTYKARMADWINLSIKYHFMT